MLYSLVILSHQRRIICKRLVQIGMMVLRIKVRVVGQEVLGVGEAKEGEEEEIGEEVMLEGTEGVLLVGVEVVEAEEGEGEVGIKVVEVIRMLLGLGVMIRR